MSAEKHPQRDAYLSYHNHKIHVASQTCPHELYGPCIVYRPEEESCMARVLVVEDEVAILIYAETVLERLGHSIVSTSNQTEALTLLETEDLDLLFTDIRLPESNLAGFELARQAREKHPSLKVVYTTGETVDDRLKALFVEGAAMLPKPYTDHGLKNALDVVLNLAK